MTFEDLARVWREEATGSYRRQRVEDVSDVLGRAGQYSSHWRRGLGRGVITAVPMILFYGYLVFTARSPLQKLGATLLVAFAAFAAYWMTAARRALPDASLPVVETIRHELTRLSALDRYFRGTHWARAFLLVIAAVFVLGAPTAPSPQRLALIVLFFAVMEAGVFRPKVRRARAKAQALKDELQNWLQGVESLEPSPSEVPLSSGRSVTVSKKNRERKYGSAESPAKKELTTFYWALGAVAIVGIVILGYSVGSKSMSPTVSAPIILEGLDDSKLMEMAAPRMKGDPDAPVVIVEFGDFQCPACGGFFSDVEPLIESEFINTGKAQFAFYDFPLVQMHPNAFIAARAARCADDQGQFWPFHDVLYRNQGRWSSLQNPVGDFEDYGEQLGLDADAFSSCLRSDRHADAISASLEIGGKLQLQATPTIYVKLAKGGMYQMVASSIDGIREGVAKIQTGCC